MTQQDYQATHPDFETYAEKMSTRESDLLYRLYRETHLKTMYPRMMSGQIQGLLLRMISRMIRPRVILEIGTFTGYSTINLALGLPESGKIHTIDSNPEPVEIGRKYFREAGLENKIATHIGNALQVVPEINEMFDLVFIDADKEHYTDYYRMVFNKVKTGGMILADNAFWDGKAFDENTDDMEARGIISFNQTVKNDSRVEQLLLPVRDGLMMVQKCRE